MFDKIISLENLFDAWTEFKKEKGNKNDVAEFEINLEDHVFALHEDLKNGTYEHGGYISFVVHDPKRRNIHKAPVRDRLLHHAVHRVIEPMWNKVFIFDSWSSRKTKGTHAAVRRLQDFALRLSHNYTRTLWVLKLDVTKFFPSVDHEILLDILSKRTEDDRLMNLFRKIIESFTMLVLSLSSAPISAFAELPFGKRFGKLYLCSNSSRFGGMIPSRFSGKRVGNRYWFINVLCFLRVDLLLLLAPHL